jgi:hypothetical protein
MQVSRIIRHSAQSLESRWPSPIHGLITKLIHVFGLVSSSRFSMLERLIRTSKLPTYELETDQHFATNIRILIVAHKKDFATLPLALKYAVAALRNYKIPTPYVIVPDESLLECRQVLAQNGISKVEILGENSFFSADELESLEESFGKRFGWVLQQLLKLRKICSDNDKYWLLVDADTLLLRPRNWFDDKGRQILTPTWEFHKPYYNFLEGKGFVGVDHSLSFIPHHMFIDRDYLIQALTTIGVNEDNDVIALVKAADTNQESPFSIDYELYGQYMHIFHPEKINLAKWSNVGVPRPSNTSEIVRIAERLNSKFASVSFHDYL